ncbi:MAG: rhomboid family intramembrane serine protease [Thermoproteota archaeon]
MKITVTLILVSCLFSLAAWSLDPVFIQECLIYSLKNILEGKAWTVFTAVFVHSNPIHLLGNMLFLFVFGETLEKELGGRRMAGSFLLGGVLAFLASTPFYGQEVGMLGASAGIFTLAAVAMLVKPLRFSWLFLSPVGVVAFLYFLYNVMLVYRGVHDSVSYIGHVLGFTVGVPLGIAWSRRWGFNLLVTVFLLALYFMILKIFLGVELFG